MGGRSSAHDLVAFACLSDQRQPVADPDLPTATLNGAYAMQLEQEVGSITTGKLANLIITRPLPSLAYMPYSFGDNLIEKVIVGGKVWA